MERRQRVVGGPRGDESTEGTDPFQNRRLSQVVAQIFESNTCINELNMCEEEGDCDKNEGIETDFIDYKEEPKNMELFRETFREIEEFFRRESPIKVKVTDTDCDQTVNTIEDFVGDKDYIPKDGINIKTDCEVKHKSVEKTEFVVKEKKHDKMIFEVKSDPNDKTECREQIEVKLRKRETEINDVHKNIVDVNENTNDRKSPIRTFINDRELASSEGANFMQPTRTCVSRLQYSNLCPKPAFTNSSIETTFGVTPPEQRSSLRSNLRRSRSPDCKRVSPTFRWSVTSV